MTGPRTLPIRVAPLPGEAFDSWIETLAARMGAPCAQLRDGIQLPSPRGYLWMQRCVHNLTPPEAAALSQATGVDRTVLQATTLSYYDGRAVLIDWAHRRVKAGFPWGWGSGSKFCPACLHDTKGRWQLRWRFGWSFACPRHHCLLAKLCPSCGKAQRQRPFPGDIVPTPGRCATPIHSAATPSIGRCNADLSAVTVARFDEDHPVLGAQRTVYDIIDGSRPHFGVYRHSDYASVEILNDLCAVAVRVLTYASDEELAKIVPAGLLSLYRENNVPPDKHSQSWRRTRLGSVAPDQTIHTAVGVTAAITMLRQPDDDAAGAAMRWMFTSKNRSGYAITATTAGWSNHPTTATLKAVQLRALAPTLKPAIQLRYRTPLLPREPDDPSVADDRIFHRVPAMFWPTWSVRFAVPGCFHSVLRAALSTAVVLVGRHITLNAAAQSIGAPIDKASLHRILTLLHDSGYWEAISEALTALNTHLVATAVPIDYRRRRTLNYADVLSDQQWQQMCDHVALPTGSTTSAETARCYLFEKVSGLPFNRAEVPAGERNLRSKVADFPRALTPELKSLLDAHGAKILAANGIHDEPLSWCPDTLSLINSTLPGPDPDTIDIEALHWLIRRDALSTHAAAHRLGVPVCAVRVALGENPAPATVSAPPKWLHRHIDDRAPAMQTLSPDEFRELYEQQRLTLGQISVRVGIPRSVLKSLAAEYHIPILKGRWPDRRQRIDYSWLHEQYVEQRRSFKEIALECGLSPATVIKRARELGIPVEHGRRHRRSVET